jgi:hypothetical protein
VQRDHRTHSKESVQLVEVEYPHENTRATGTPD